jgi:hypothetical protein
MYERAILRIGAVSLAVGLIAVVVFEALHPAREDPNNNPRVFAEYAADGDWTTVHLGALAGALLLIGGLVALCGALGLGPAVSAAWARLATATAVTAEPVRRAPSGRRCRVEAGGGRLGRRALGLATYDR